MAGSLRIQPGGRHLPRLDHGHGLPGLCGVMTRVVTLAFDRTTRRVPNEWASSAAVHMVMIYVFFCIFFFFLLLFLDMYERAGESGRQRGPNAQEPEGRRLGHESVWGMSLL